MTIFFGFCLFWQYGYFSCSSILIALPSLRVLRTQASVYCLVGGWIHFECTSDEKLKEQYRNVGCPDCTESYIIPPLLINKNSASQFVISPKKTSLPLLIIPFLVINSISNLRHYSNTPTGTNPNQLSKPSLFLFLY